MMIAPEAGKANALKQAYNQLAGERKDTGKKEKTHMQLQQATCTGVQLFCARQAVMHSVARCAAERQLGL